MKPLLRRVYFWFQRRSLLGTTNVLGEFDRAQTFLFHLPQEVGRTVFCLPAVRALKDRFPKAQFSAVTKDHNQMLLSCTDTFDRAFFYKEYPLVYTEEHKRLEAELSGFRANVFVDFNEPGSRELALLSRSAVRLGFYAEGSFPYFNFLLQPASGQSELDRYSSLVGSVLGLKPSRLVELKVPLALRRRAQSFLRERGWSTARPLVLAQTGVPVTLPEPSPLVIDIRDVTTPELIPGVMSAAQLFVGPPSEYFELALGLRRPTILLLSPKAAAGFRVPVLDFLNIVSQEDDRLPAALQAAIPPLLSARVS